MPTVLRRGPDRPYFFSHEPHEPAHVHVERDAARAKFWLRPPSLAGQRGFSQRELRRIHRIVAAHEFLLLQAWHDYFGT